MLVRCTQEALRSLQQLHPEKLRIVCAIFGRVLVPESIADNSPQTLVRQKTSLPALHRTPRGTCKLFRKYSISLTHIHAHNRLGSAALSWILRLRPIYGRASLAEKIKCVVHPTNTFLANYRLRSPMACLAFCAVLTRERCISIALIYQRASMIVARLLV